MEDRAMLVLSRKKGEQIRIGNDIVITVHRLSGNRVSLGIEAPAHCRITRGELKTLLEELEYAPEAGTQQPEAAPRAPAAAVRTETRDARGVMPVKTTTENRIAAHLPPSMRSPK
jgi:carbon storage regulator